MTITKAIEAAREAFQACVPHIEQSLLCIEQTLKYRFDRMCGCVDQPSHDDFEQWKGVHICDLHKAKATLEGVLACCKNNGTALPDKPKSEDEIIEKVCRILHSQAYCNDREDDEWRDFEHDARQILNFLKAADVLYVEDK